MYGLAHGPGHTGGSDGGGTSIEHHAGPPLSGNRVLGGFLTIRLLANIHDRICENQALRTFKRYEPMRSFSGEFFQQ